MEGLEGRKASQEELEAGNQAGEEEAAMEGVLRESDNSAMKHIIIQYVVY